MFYYVVYVRSDGSSTRIEAASVGNAEDLFNQAVNLPDVVYAHFAEAFNDYRINWYARPTD